MKDDDVVEYSKYQKYKEIYLDKGLKALEDFLKTNELFDDNKIDIITRKVRNEIFSEETIESWALSKIDPEDY